MAKIVITATVKAKKGKEDIVSEAIQKIVLASRDEPGTETYVAWQHDDDPQTFSIFEIYTDEEAFQAHTKSTVYVKEAGALGEHLEGGTQVVRGKLVLAA